MRRKKCKILKTIALVLVSVILVIGLLFGAYILYLNIEYYRIEDNLDLTGDVVKGTNTSELELDKEYSITTYNIGFGAYSREYSFFMDEGVMNDGTKVKGKYGKAISKDDVLKNINGAKDLIKDLNPDFMIFQEVDVDSTRSYHVNETEILNDTFSDYSHLFSCNFHSSYFIYPFHDFHGKSLSGLVTYSSFEINKAVRYSLPIASDFSKFFDLDRSISEIRIPFNDKELVILNAHFSAYDKGGVYRKQQLELVNKILTKEYNDGNYCILGGDFNQILTDEVSFKNDQKKPEWVVEFPKDELVEGYHFAVGTNGPTCRGADIPYEKDVDYTCIIDGFIVSDNIEVVSVTNVNEHNGNDIAFMYSDHNPVLMKFKLK